MTLRTLFYCALASGAVHAEEWQLRWSEEFNYTGLPDPAKWGYEEGFVRNRELQIYTQARKENVRVENGVLIIEAQKEEVPNPGYVPDSERWQDSRKVAQYTSGSINTLGKVDFLYGRLEVRARLPQGKGMWPAIWMMGINRSEVGWPHCGEIDIMEYVGKEPHRIYATTHFADPKVKDKSIRGRAAHQSGGGGVANVHAPYEQFHRYACEWDEQHIRFFIDDKPYATFNIDKAGSGKDNPFRKPHYLLLNLAIGGSWGGPVEDAVLPQRYEIDYVRYYQKTDPQTQAADKE